MPHVAAVSVTIPYSATPVADADLDGTPGTGAWGDALSVTIPLENGAAAPYGSATLFAKHDGTFFYLRIDGSIDVPWTSAAGNHFWLGMQMSPTGTSHHGGGTWDGLFFGLWDGTDYSPQPVYPPVPVDTNGFARPPSADASQDAFGRMRSSGTAAPYSFTAEWKKRLNTGDASDIAYAADGIATYNFFVTTDSNGRGSQGGNIDHSGITNANTLRFGAPPSPNTPPTVDLTTPNGGEVWSAGSVHTIRWNMSDAETPTSSLAVWINVSTDGGTSYSPIAGAQGLSGLTNPCTYGWTLPTTTTSQARVRITVLDARSASASDASLANFGIDGTPPTVTGFAPGDGSTGVPSTTTVRVSFSEPMDRPTAEAAFSLRRVDTGTYLAGSRSWSGNDLVFTPGAALAEGVVYRAQMNGSAEDASDPGNPVGTVATAAFTTADSTPPSITSLTAVPSPQEAGGRVNVSAVVTDNGVLSGVWVEVYLPGGALLANASAAYDGTSGRYYHEAAYSRPGTHAVRVVARDAGGIWAVATTSFAIADTAAPVIEHTPVAEAVRDVPLRITALVSDADAVADVRLDYTDVLGARSNVSMVLNGSLYEYTIPGQPQLGALSYFVWAVDPSGNRARTPTYAVAVTGADVTSPTIQNVAATPPQQDVGFPVNLTADISDNVALQEARVEIRRPDSQILENVSLARLAASDAFYYERSYNDLGVHPFQMWAVDGSGNVALASGTFEILDRLPPVIASLSVAPGIAEAGADVRVAVNITDNARVARVDLLVRDASGTIVENRTLTGTGGNLSLILAFTTLGNHTLEITATDDAGNAAVSGTNFTVVDTTPPQARAGPDVEVGLGTRVSLDATASWDNSAIVNVTWSFDYNGTAILLYGPTADFVFEVLGEYNVTLQVTDAAGLADVAWTTVRVVTDTTGPPAPGNPVASPTSADCLRISWSPSDAPDLAGYQVYRWNATASRFELLAEVSSSTTSYVDCGLEAGETYRYWVVAFDLLGNPSPPSAIATGQTDAGGLPPSGSQILVELVVAAALVSAVVAAVAWAGRRKRLSPPAGPR